MTVQKEWEKSALDVPNLGVLLDAAEKKAPTLVAAARKELEVLLDFAANEYLQNYSEIYGVPRGCEKWSAADLQIWVRTQQQEGL